MKTIPALLLLTALVGFMVSCKERPQTTTLRAENHSDLDLHDVILKNSKGKESRFGVLIPGSHKVFQGTYPIQDGELYTLEWVANDAPYTKNFSLNIAADQEAPGGLSVIITKELEVQVSF